LMMLQLQLLVFVFVFVVDAQQEQEQEDASSIVVTLRFTAIPDQDDAVERDRAGAVSSYLSEYLSEACFAGQQSDIPNNGVVRVEFVPVADYDAAVAALVGDGDDGDDADFVDFGWYGGLTGVRAYLKALAATGGNGDGDGDGDAASVSGGAALVAQRAEDQQFTTTFIRKVQPEEDGGGDGEEDDAASGSSIEYVDGKTLAYGSEESTSGHLMPAYFLRQYNISPSDFGFTGSHDDTVDAVAADGVYQVGALNSVVWERRVATGTTNGTVAFYVTPPYFDYLWIAGPRFARTWDAAVADASSTSAGNTTATTTCTGNDVATNVLRQAFLDASASGTPEARAVLESYSAGTFVAVPPFEESYLPILEIGCELDLIDAGDCAKAAQVFAGVDDASNDNDTATVEDAGDEDGDDKSTANENSSGVSSVVVVAAIEAVPFPFFACRSVVGLLAGVLLPAVLC